METRLDWFTHNIIGSEQQVHIRPVTDKNPSKTVVLSLNDSRNLNDELNEAANRDKGENFACDKQAILRKFYRTA
jgi:hypothetical protein